MNKQDVRDGLPVLVRDKDGNEYQRGVVEQKWEYGPDLMWILSDDGRRRCVMIERSEPLCTETCEKS